MPKLSIRGITRRLVLAIFCLFSILFSQHTAAGQNPHAAKLVPVKVNTARKPEPVAPLIAPSGSDVYTAQRGDSIPSVARKYLRKTKYLTSSELGDAIRTTNSNRQGVFLKPGEQILIPGILESPIVEKTVPVARDFEVARHLFNGCDGGKWTRRAHYPTLA